MPCPVASCSRFAAGDGRNLALQLHLAIPQAASLLKVLGPAGERQLEAAVAERADDLPEQAGIAAKPARALAATGISLCQLQCPS